MRSALFRHRSPAPITAAKATGPNAVQTRGALRRLSSAAIVAVAALPLLGACGQRGPLYLPTVPPLPAPPGSAAYATPNNGTATADGANATTDSNGTSPSVSAKGAE
jgi:predicted small lipoprotein YifL